MSKRKPIQREPEYEVFLDRARNTVNESHFRFGEHLLVLSKNIDVARVNFINAIPDGVIRDTVAYLRHYDNTSLFLAKYYYNGVGVVQVMPNGEVLISAWRSTWKGWLQLENGRAAILIERTMSRLLAMSGIAESRLTHSAPAEVQ